MNDEPSVWIVESRYEQYPEWTALNGLSFSDRILALSVEAKMDVENHNRQRSFRIAEYRRVPEEPCRT